jgi:hypothetical protein
MLPELSRLAPAVCAAGLFISSLALERQLDAAPLVIAGGQVVSIDRSSLHVHDMRDNTVRVFAVNQSTKIMRNGVLTRLADLRPGDAAQITVRPLGDKLLALTVTAEGPPRVR